MQWKIVEHAYHRQHDLAGLEPKKIRELYAAGADAERDPECPWLDYLGKRFGLIPWSSQKEKESWLRTRRSTRSNKSSKRKWR